MKHLLIAMAMVLVGACTQPMESQDPLAKHDAVVARYAESQVRMCVKLEEPKCLIPVIEQLNSWCSVYEGEGCRVYEAAEGALDDMIN